MSNFILVCVKDTISGFFSEPKPFYNKAMALRWFKGLCQESKISNDLQLFSLGSFNSETGEIVSEVQFIEGGANNG